MLDLPAIEHRYLMVNGVRFHIACHGHGARLVLLLHGFPEMWYAWRHIIATLGDDLTVAAPDLRGYNETGKPVWGYERDVLTRDIVALIDALGFRTAVVVGHDWGGVIAWDVAITYPWRVERLAILNAPHPALFEEALRTSATQRQRSWYVALFQLPLLPELRLRANDYAILRGIFAQIRGPYALSDDEIHQFVQAFARPGAATAALNYYRQAAQFGTRGMHAGTGMRVTVPTLVIWGEQDFALGTELLNGLDRFVADLRVERVPACGHWVQQERPDLVRGLLRAFLAEANEVHDV